MRKYSLSCFDHLLTLLPFEPPYFEQVGLASTFVGHPIVAETAAGDGAAFRKRYDLSENTPLFCVLPGSSCGRDQTAICRFLLVRSHCFQRCILPLAIVVPVPKHLLEVVKPYFVNCPFRAIVTAHAHDKIDGIAASNLAIVKIGYGDARGGESPHADGGGVLCE